MNNLPAETSSFVGREQPLAQLCDLVCRPGVRLVTLTGAGGTGKTRLAIRAARRLLNTFEAGACFVRLAAVTDPDLVLPAVGRALGLKQAAGHSATEALIRHIGSADLLLILDNMEQVLGAGSALVELLGVCPRLRVLVTSRAVLRLNGEHEFAVPPLEVPRQSMPLALDDVRANEAVALFAERARAAQQGFAVTQANAAAVADVCRLVDGLPLAIELAAARLRVLPLPVLARRLERRLPLLTGGPRDAPERQQTLRHTISWSYDLLGPAEQTLFRRLAVFRGCTLEAIEAVCCAAANGPGTASVALAPLALDPLDGVTSLVEQSLLRRIETADGRPWYAMLETVREYALELLDATDETGPLRRRHALHCMRLAEDADQDLHGPRQRSLLDYLELEHDNLREALLWCTNQGYAEPAMRIASALWWFWFVRGYAREGLDILEAILQRFNRGMAASPRAHLRVHALEAAGHLAAFLGDLDAALARHQENLDLVRALGDDIGLYRTLQNLGFVSRQQGHWDAAQDYFERCLSLARAKLQPPEIGYALYNLGNLAHDRGSYAEARSLLDESLPFIEETADPRQTGNVHAALGLVALDQGDYGRARQEAEIALALREQSGDQRSTATSTIITLASVMMAQGEFDRAGQLILETLQVVQGLGDPLATAGLLERLAVLLIALGEPEQALRLAGAVAALRDSRGVKLPPTERHKLETELARAREAAGRDAAAAAYESGRRLTLEQAIAEALVCRLSPATSKVSPPVHQQREPLESGKQQTASPLTEREQEVAALVAGGASNRQIAEALVIAEGTAANHVLHIMNKLGLGSRTQIAVWAVRHGLVAEPQPAAPLAELPGR